MPLARSRVVQVKAPSNEAFFSAHARAGCVGLVGGEAFVDRMIRRSQRRLNVDREWSHFSHAFLFVGPREDGHLCALESDMDFHRERALFCSAFVQHLYEAIGIDFAPDVDTKLTLPEDIARTAVPHVAYVRSSS